METNCPLISIVIPVYNVEQYLGECVDSVIAQTYREWEIILIDDGSTDSSGSICDGYAKKDDRVRVVHQTNGGVSSARNAGIEAANGEYLMFVDSDDTIIPETLALMVSKMKEFEADIVSAGKLHSGSDFEGDVLVWEGAEAVRQSLRDHPRAFSSCAKLYRRDLVAEKRFSTDVKINEDTLFLFELLCKKPKVVNIREQVYFYRSNTQSASRTGYSPKFEDILTVSDRKYQIVKELFPQFLDLSDNMRLKARMNLLKILCVRTQNEEKDLERELIGYIQKNHKAYISMNRYDDSWLRIVRHHLYYAYKQAYRCLK